MAQISADVINEVRVRTAPEVSDATWTPLVLRPGQSIQGEVVNGWLKYTDERYVVYGRDNQRQEFLYSILRDAETELIRTAPGVEPVKPGPSPGPSPDSPAQPIKHLAPKLGISVLVNHHLLEPAYQAGIRAFLIMEGLLAAVEFKQKHPDAVVMYRRFLPHGGGIPEARLFSGETKMGNGVVFVSPLNECDSFCYGSPAEIEQRARFDVTLGEMCRQHGTLYAAGGFSMGTPDFTNAAICDAMRQFYAPAYNAGTFAMNMHLYSPNMGWIFGRNKAIDLGDLAQFPVDENGVQRMPVGRDGHLATIDYGDVTRSIGESDQRIWFERRWEMLFTKCGFNPDPKLLGIYCDETGVDEGGVGGFPAHQANSGEVNAWCREFVRLNGLPLTANGVTHASPFRAAAIFQAGEKKNWTGYNVEPWFNEIASANG